MKFRILAGAAGLAALATAAPAAAQYAYPGYANPYGNAYAYGYNYNPYARAYNPYAAQAYNPYAAQMTQVAAQRCTAAVQQRLSTPQGIAGILGAVIGVPTATGRVVSITQVNPRRSTVRVRGLATSGRMAGYGPYGVGAYGALGYAYQPDLSFSCTVDYRGYVRDVDINRRR